MDEVVFFVKSDDKKQNSLSNIGQKAQGLIECNLDCIPKFIIITASLFSIWKEDRTRAISILEDNKKLFIDFFKNHIIIRSSAKKETFNERGYYESSSWKISVDNIIEELEKVWLSNIKLVELIPENDFSLIIQEFIPPIFQGHLSNERSIAQNTQNWFYEIIDNKDNFIESTHFLVKKWNDKPIDFKCTDIIKLREKLKLIASYLSSEQRCHIEWVWDKKRLWIVQKDHDNNIVANTYPGKAFEKYGGDIISTSFEPKILKTIETSQKEWKKTNCIKTFIQCGCAFGHVYIIEGEDLLSKIYENNFSEDFEKELMQLLSFPIVIRMDIDREIVGDNLLLPRTGSLFSLSEIKKFTIDNLERIAKQGISFGSVCFLLHRFIISKSGALAFAKPKINQARIDSTWGIVDGLHYFSHDSFEYNLYNEKLKKQIRCKSEYLDVNEKGEWITIKTGHNIDWAESLSRSQIIEITQTTQKIADYLNCPVTVMFFVSVHEATGYPPILPWFYTTEEISESGEKFSQSIFSEKRFLIKDWDDFERLKDQVGEISKRHKICIKLKLIPSLLRDKNFIEEIGAFAKEKNLPIEIEGSILSHPYYILRKKQAIVKARNIFDPDYDAKKFYKLVRDNVPVSIINKGEKAKYTDNVNPKVLLELLKQKLIEEALECYWEDDHDNLVLELADLYEVIRGIIKLFQIPEDDLFAIADKKRIDKGGFEKGVFLIETKQQGLITVIDATKNTSLLDDLSISLLKEEKYIPEHTKSTYIDDKLILPYIPPLGNKKSKKIEKIAIDDIYEYIIEFTKNNIQIRKAEKPIEKKNDSQLSFDF